MEGGVRVRIFLRESKIMKGSSVSMDVIKQNVYKVNECLLTYLIVQISFVKIWKGLLKWVHCEGQQTALYISGKYYDDAYGYILSFIYLS